MENSDKIADLIKIQEDLITEISFLKNYRNEHANIMEAVDERTRKIQDIMEEKLNVITELENIMEAIDERTKQILDKMDNRLTVITELENIMEATDERTKEILDKIK
jgi:cysteinyl-tRNA synthetase